MTTLTALYYHSYMHIGPFEIVVSYYYAWAHCIALFWDFQYVAKIDSQTKLDSFVENANKTKISSYNGQYYNNITWPG